MLENRRCKYWLARHTVWYWLEDGASVPAPYSFTFTNQQDAVVWAQGMTKNAPVQLRWIKVFKSGNTSYMCWHWYNSKSMPAPEPDIIQDSFTFWQRVLRRKL